MTVSDKTVIITGAGSTRGIGRATAHALAAAGWNVAILDLNEPSAKQAADEVAERQQVQTVGVGCDVTDGRRGVRSSGVLGGESCRARVRSRARPGAGAQWCNGQRCRPQASSKPISPAGHCRASVRHS
jgi:NAD(P)-dependent dehydrogenase (short-subunit alcohol dehydrogenase family)